MPDSLSRGSKKIRVELAEGSTRAMVALLGRAMTGPELRDLGTVTADVRLLLELGFVQRQYHRDAEGEFFWQLTDDGRAALRPEDAS